MRRATKTAYYLNLALKRLALIAANVRFPQTPGIWILAADADRAPWEVQDLLVAAHAGTPKEDLKFVALLTDFDVDEFELVLNDS